ncbi:MAG: RNA methyltransferase [Spirochaetes bacterium]|nr:MAG: RNA methyltransferase [Spirochaetota bacterium]
MNKFLDQVQIVLVEPQDGANIGAVCRAMKTMGITHLAITGSKEYDENRVFTLALHAREIYLNAERFSTLEDALKKSVLSFGASRRRGKFRKYFSMSPVDMAEKTAMVGRGTVSIVFGRESDGLTDKELSLCDAAVRIPTSELFPSLNLAQAVQIITYTLFTYTGPFASYTPVKREELDHLTGIITESLDRIKFFKLEEKEEVGRFFSDIFARSLLSRSEAKRLEKMFKKIASIKIHKKN